MVEGVPQKKNTTGIILAIIIVIAVSCAGTYMLWGAFMEDEETEQGPGYDAVCNYTGYIKDRVGDSKPGEGYVFYDVILQITNERAEDGIKTNPFYWDMSTLYVGGVLYKPDTITMSNENDSVIIPTGSTHKFHVIFEIPEDSTPGDIVLNYEGSAKIVRDKSIPVIE